MYICMWMCKCHKDASRVSKMNEDSVGHDTYGVMGSLGKKKNRNRIGIGTGIE